MISVLYNLISFPMILAGFGLDNLILILVAPLGFITLGSLLIFFEYRIIKSIAKDPNKIDFKKIFNYIRNYKVKDLSITSSQWTALGMVFNKKNIGTKEISNNIGITIGEARKLMSGLINNGYIMRGLSINDGHAFCYITSDKYRGQRRYNI